MYCIVCGREFLEDTKFCPYCGVEQTMTPGSAPLAAGQINQQNLPQNPYTVPQNHPKAEPVPQKPKMIKKTLRSGVVFDMDEKKHKKQTLVWAILSVCVSLVSLLMLVALLLLPPCNTMTFGLLANCIPGLAEAVGVMLGFFAILSFPWSIILAIILIPIVVMFIAALVKNLFDLIGNIIALTKFNGTYEEERKAALEDPKYRNKAWKKFSGRKALSPWILANIAMLVFSFISLIVCLILYATTGSGTVAEFFGASLLLPMLYTAIHISFIIFESIVMSKVKQLFEVKKTTVKVPQE